MVRGLNHLCTCILIPLQELLLIGMKCLLLWIARVKEKEAGNDSVSPFYPKDPSGSLRPKAAILQEQM